MQACNPVQPHRGHSLSNILFSCSTDNAIAVNLSWVVFLELGLGFKVAIEHVFRVDAIRFQLFWCNLTVTRDQESLVAVFTRPGLQYSDHLLRLRPVECTRILCSSVQSASFQTRCRSHRGG